MSGLKGSIGQVIGFMAVLAVMLLGLAPQVAAFLSTEVTLVSLVVGLWLLLPKPENGVNREHPALGFWGHRGRPA